MASASAAERSQEEPNLQSKRGQQVVLTFSQQVGGGHHAVSLRLKSLPS
jgi:hypothetical protein